jgi:hypothetical protein
MDPQIMLSISQAKTIARQWLAEHATSQAGFVGALVHGSAAYLAEDATLAATSDLDILIILDGALPAQKVGKLRYQNLVLEVSPVAYAEVATPAQILASSHYAGSFRAGAILADPTDQLYSLCQIVAANFTKRSWVQRRCEHVEQKIHTNLTNLEHANELHDQVASWLFATGLTTHLILVAGLQNPTVRQRYLATRELLTRYRLADCYPSLLDLLGGSHLSQQRISYHLEQLAELFDTASRVIRSPLPYAADISGIGRPIAIDGSTTLIQQGNHHEALFWLAATYTRCINVLHLDAPDLIQHYRPRFLGFLEDLNISSVHDLRTRRAHLITILPEVWGIAQRVMQANQEIT